MPFITQGKTNIKYILIVIILATIVGGGILGYQYWWAQKEEIPSQIINTDKNNLHSCATDDDCLSSCGCGCINKNKFCPGDELKECDGYPCQCSNNKCAKKDEIPKKECIDSTSECKGKPDGTSCTFGSWCDEQGRICGGQSCVGLGLGQCFQGECLSASQQIIDKCEEEKKIIEEVLSDPDCLKGKDFRCVDGWGVTIYYDKKLAEGIEIPPSGGTESLDVLKKLKDATIGTYNNSTCNCKTPITYEVLINEELKEVKCEDFYKSIEEYNSDCEGCILEWEGGCC